MEYLLLENGDKLLLENTGGNLLESYVPPEDFIAPDVQVADTAVTTLVNVNTPKFMAPSLTIASAMHVGFSLVSSDPNKTFPSIDVQVGNVETTLNSVRIVSPRHYYPVKHYIWVHNIAGEQVNVLD